MVVIKVSVEDYNALVARVRAATEENEELRDEINDLVTLIATMVTAPQDMTLKQKTELVTIMKAERKEGRG